MAASAVTVTTLAVNTGTAPTTTAIDATNGNSIDCSAFPLEELLIRVTNTTASTKTVTVAVGTNPPASAAGQGTIAAALTDGSTTPQVANFSLSSARFLQSASKVQLTFTSGMTGTVEAIRIPRNG